MAGLFQVLYGSQDGFQPADVLTGTDGEPLIIPADEENVVDKICTRATAVDIDDDGDLDIVSGNFAGSFFLFEGLGKGQFNPTPTKLTCGDGDLTVDGMHSDPFFVDWDGDGDQDMLSGTGQGGVYLITNSGTRKRATFEEPKEIVKPAGHASTSEGFGDAHLKGPQSSTRVWASDVNGDGKLDLLVGDNVQLMHLAEGVDEETARVKDAAWRERFNTHLRSQPQDPEKMQDWMERYHELNAEREEYVVPESTGFVWLYVRK